MLPAEMSGTADISDIARSSGVNNFPAILHAEA